MFKKYSDTTTDLTETTSKKTEALLHAYVEEGYDAEVLYTLIEERAAFNRSKKIHDIKGALRTLKMATDAIENGYKFDDDVAKLKISAMQKAVAALETEIIPIIALISPK